MRVGLDLWHATLDSGGIGRYAVELTKALVALQSESSGLSYVLFPGRGQPAWMETVLAEHANTCLGIRRWRWPRAGIPARVARAALLIARRSRALGVDVLHCMDFLDTPLGAVGRTRIVATVHDISPILYPETFTRRHALFFGALARTLARRADRLITVSHAAAGEIIEWDGTLSEKLSVVHLGVSDVFRPAEPRIVDEVRTRYQLPAEYLVCLATVQPRKNLERLVDAYALLIGRDALVPPLVVAGRLGWLYGPILRAVAERRLQAHVRLLGFVPDEHLPALLTGAKAFVFPSIHEGFGLPVLEAMACGTPVVTSNCSSLPEIAGDAAVLVDPRDVESIAHGIQRILTDAALAADLMQRGFRRAATFTWTRAAQRTLDVYRACVGQTPRVERA